MTTNNPVPGMAEKIGLRAAEAAGLIGVSRSTFCQWHTSGRLPRPRRLGRVVLWDRAELIAWFKAKCPPRQKWEAMQNVEGNGI